MNREPFDRKIQLTKKDILCSKSFIDWRNSIPFQVQNQLLEVQVNTAFPTYLACTKLRTAGVNMQIPLTTTLINSWTDNKPYTFRRKPGQNSNKSGYHFSDKECFSRKLHSKIETILTELHTHTLCGYYDVYYYSGPVCCIYTILCLTYVLWCN